MNTYTAIIKETDSWWIGWIEELPGVNCQESTYDDLLKSLKDCLTEAIEFNRQEALLSAGKEYHETCIAI